MIKFPLPHFDIFLHEQTASFVTNSVVNRMSSFKIKKWEGKKNKKKNQFFFKCHLGLDYGGVSLVLLFMENPISLS